MSIYLCLFSFNSYQHHPRQNNTSWCLFSDWHYLSSLWQPQPPVWGRLFKDFVVSAFSKADIQNFVAENHEQNVWEKNHVNVSQSNEQSCSTYWTLEVTVLFRLAIINLELARLSFLSTMQIKHMLVLHILVWMLTENVRSLYCSLIYSESCLWEKLSS